MPRRKAALYAEPLFVLEPEETAPEPAKAAQQEEQADLSVPAQPPQSGQPQTRDQTKKGLDVRNRPPFSRNSQSDNGTSSPDAPSVPDSSFQEDDRITPDPSLSEQKQTPQPQIVPPQPSPNTEPFTETVQNPADPALHRLPPPYPMKYQSNAHPAKNRDPVVKQPNGPLSSAVCSVSIPLPTHTTNDVASLEDLKSLFEHMFPGYAYVQEPYRDAFSLQTALLQPDGSPPDSAQSTAVEPISFDPGWIHDNPTALFHLKILVPDLCHPPLCDCTGGKSFQLERERIEAAKNHTLLLLLQPDYKQAASVEEALIEGELYVSSIQIRGSFSSLKEKLETGMKTMLKQMVPNRSLIRKHVFQAKEVAAAMKRDPYDHLLFSQEEPNQKALDMVEAWLHQNNQRRQTVTMPLLLSRFQQAPYGWLPLDIAWCAARLWGLGIVQIYENTQPADPASVPLVRQMLDSSRSASIEIRLQQHLSPAMHKELLEFLPIYLPGFSAPFHPADLPDALCQRLTALWDHYAGLLALYKTRPYPEQEKLETVKDDIIYLLHLQNDPEALFCEMVQHQKQLLAHQAEVDDLEYFFESQRPLFDEALQLLDDLQNDVQAMQMDRKLGHELHRIKEILGMEQPYDCIEELHLLVLQVRTDYQDRKDTRQEEISRHLIDQITAVDDITHQIQGRSLAAEETLEVLKGLQKKAADLQTLHELEALDKQADRYVRRQMETLGRILSAQEQRNQRQTEEPAAKTIPQKQIFASDTVERSADKPERIKKMYRFSLCPAAALRSESEIEAYTRAIQEKLMNALQESDCIQIE